MPTGKPTAVVADPLAEAPRAWLAERCGVVDGLWETPGEPASGARAELSEASALVVRTRTPVDARLLAQMPALKVVGRAGVGLDHIDVGLCARSGVTVVHTPDSNTQAVVEFVFSALFDALRPRLYLHEPLDPGRWESLRAELVAPRQLADLTFGVYGMGRIGKRVSQVASALGARTIYHDLVEVPPGARTNAEPVSRETLLDQADIISVHVDGRSQNRGLLDADAFGRMRSDVVFLNTSRGFVVDPVSCADFFVNHPGATAILDVHEPEPVAATSPLLGIENVHLSPHIASATAAAKEAMGWVVRDVWRVLCGETPAFPAAVPG